MKNNKDSSNGINRKSFKRTGSKSMRSKGTRRKISRSKRLRLKKYSKRKNLKKSDTKMKGGAVPANPFEEGKKSYSVVMRYFGKGGKK
jgi:hypothetical protein